MTAHWGIPDPVAVTGSAEEVGRSFREAFRLLQRRIDLFLSLSLENLQKLPMQKEIDQIGRR